MKFKHIAYTVAAATCTALAIAPFVYKKDIDELVRPTVSYNTHTIHTGTVNSKEEFFDLSCANLLTRIALLEDDTFANTREIVEIMCQRSAEEAKRDGKSYASLKESLLKGGYSGINVKNNSVPKRALRKEISLDDITKVVSMLQDTLDDGVPYHEKGADHFMHKFFPSDLSLSQITHLTNTSEEFRSRYDIPSWAAGNIVSANYHKERDGINHVFLAADVWKN